MPYSNSKICISEILIKFMKGTSHSKQDTFFLRNEKQISVEISSFIGNYHIVCKSFDFNMY